MHTKNRNIADYLARAQQFLDARSTKHLDFRMEVGDPEGEPNQAPADQGAPKPTDVPPKTPKAVEQPKPNGPKGYPEDTPVSQMTDEQRAAYDTEKRRRNEVWREATGGRTADELKADLAELTERRQASETDAERAVREARAEERAAVLAEVNDKVSATLLRTSLSIRGKSAEQIEQILSTTNMQAFVVDGEVDDTKVTAYVDNIAAPLPGGSQPWSGTGQGVAPPVPTHMSGKDIREKYLAKK